MAALNPNPTGPGEFVGPLAGDGSFRRRRGLHGLALADEILALNDDAGAVAQAGDPHEALFVFDQRHRHEPDLRLAVDSSDTEIASRRERQGRTWHPHGVLRSQSNHHLGGYAVRNRAVRVWKFDLNLI